MSFFNKIPIQVRFTIFWASTSLAFLILFSLVVYSQAKKKSYTFAQSSLTTLLEHEWEHLDLPLHQDVKTQARSTPHFKDVYLRIWKSGTLLYDSFPLNFPPEFPPEGILAHNKLFHSFKKEHNNHQYELQGFYDLTSTLAYLSFLRNILVVSCLLAGVLLVPLSLLSARLLLKPLRELAERTTEVTAERLMFRFQVPEAMDEYGILTKNFNELLVRLEKSFLQVKRFALNASHELRTPLAVIISQGEMARRKERSISEYQTAIDKMLGPAKRLREIVNRLLYLAELEQLEQEKRITTIDVGKAIESLAATIRDAYGTQTKAVSIVNENGSANFVGNREVFDVVMANLIENAYKFSRTAVRVSYRKKQNGLTVLIEDDGPGAPEEYLGTILEPLSKPQIQSEETQSKRGAGLGLSIVKACLDSVNGTIEMSQSKLGGLSVNVIFPQNENST